MCCFISPQAFCLSAYFIFSKIFEGESVLENQITRKITESAIMIALATVLSLIVLFRMPYGGSVTAASMAPIIFLSLRSNLRQSLLSAFAFSLLQMLLGFVASPVQDLSSFVLVILLDYVIAFGVLGLAGSIARRFKNRTAAVVAGTAIAIFLRFLCHLLSGMIIWGVYAPEGQNVFVYSLVYNGGYMLAELVITTAVMVIMSRIIDFKTLKRPQF